MATLEELLAALEAEARRADFPVDVPVYEQFGKDPLVPILCAGSLAAPVCSFGRDLGRDEVRHGQPQIGSAGRLVRQGILSALGLTAPPPDRYLEAALPHVLLSNTVPYKPPGNKAYPERVKERFRPFVVAFLADCWQGDRILTLGTEAFRWFDPYAEPGAMDALWRREDRYEAELPCRLTAVWAGEALEKRVVVCPLPHPSPLNAQWVGRFPDLLQKRLASIANPQGEPS
ncbi:MAG: uracil-DNA glycosylase [SAR202 cluster bacterium]|nr:uracil-DNA glycosylase [SAR202 cluster bacterium]